MSEQTFHWDDPLLLDEQLTGEERAIQDAARAYAQERLARTCLEERASAIAVARWSKPAESGPASVLS